MSSRDHRLTLNRPPSKISRWVSEARSTATATSTGSMATCVTQEAVIKARRLNEVARQRGQTLAQLALAWVLRLPVMTSALIGASRVEQIEDAVSTLQNLELSESELQTIENILKSS